MDKLDKLTAITISVLLLYGSLLLVRADGSEEPQRPDNAVLRAQQVVLNPMLDKKIELAKTLLIEDNIEKSEELVESLLGEHPYMGSLYMLKGDILMRRQQPIAAMYEYKEAISLNPDFLDKKTELFQGKKIKNTVNEAHAAIESGLEKDPSSERLKDGRQVVYFMKRKLAGSCG